MGFAQGVSGLNAASNNLDVIGNNVANSGTVGFKTGSVLFADVYAGSRVGLGTHVAGITQNFTQGAVQTSTRALDMAITGGDGFFVWLVLVAKYPIHAMASSMWIKITISSAQAVCV